MLSEYINCILCNSKKNKKSISIKDDFGKLHNIVKCECGFLFLNPRPDIKSIKKYYSDEYLPFQGEKHSFYFKLFRKISFFWKFNKINKIKKNGNLIDVGSGDNRFIDYMKLKGWECCSYEPFNNDNSIDSVDNLENCTEKFDIITFWHSIEHMHNLTDIITLSCNLLKNDGYIFIAIPNSNSVDCRLLKEKWIAYDIPRHLYHFNSNTIKKLLYKFNINIIASKGMYQDTLFNLYASLKNISIYKLIILFPFYFVYSFISILVNKDKSSSLLLICQKK